MWRVWFARPPSVEEWKCYKGFLTEDKEEHLGLVFEILF